MDGKKQTGKPAGTELFTEAREGSRKETGVHAGFADWDCRGAAYLNITQVFPELSKKHFSPAFRYPHHMVLAIPFCVA
jgi:hypothetical protein